jgi:hypothetical protein
MILQNHPKTPFLQDYFPGAFGLNWVLLIFKIRAYYEKENSAETAACKDQDLKAGQKQSTCSREPYAAYHTVRIMWSDLLGVLKRCH